MILLCKIKMLITELVETQKDIGEKNLYLSPCQCEEPGKTDRRA